MNTTYKQQIEAIQKAITCMDNLSDNNGKAVRLNGDVHEYNEMRVALNDAVKTIELTPVLQGHIDNFNLRNVCGFLQYFDEYKAKIAELEKHLAHYADVNQNQ